MIELDGLPAVTLVVLLVLPLMMLGGALLLLRTFIGSADGVYEEALPRARPWWGNPLVWLGVAGVSLFLGLFVFPQFLGGLVFFLPFVWIGGGRRSRARR